MASHDSSGSNVPERERIRLRDGLRVEDLGDEIVILDADGDALHRVKGDALAAVRLLQEGVARRDIPAELTDAVTSLADAGLVDGPNHLSRRAALVSGGGIALTAATVTTFALADPAAALTMCAGGFTPTQPDAGPGSGNKYTVQGTYTYNTGPGVTSLLVRAWGAGGGGGGGGYDRGGGGGGGGAYASTPDVPVSECTGYTVVVGAGGMGGDNGKTLMPGSSGGTGGTSSFGGTLVVAAGGTGGGGGYDSDPSVLGLDRTPGAGGAGGTTAASTGTTEYKGGNGGAGRDDISGGGGGGGSAGAGGAGGDGQTPAMIIASGAGGTAGAGTPAGAAGGEGTYDDVGMAGSTPGGGGGGGSGLNNHTGGGGADGAVWVGV